MPEGWPYCPCPSPLQAEDDGNGRNAQRTRAALCSPCNILRSHRGPLHPPTHHHQLPQAWHPLRRKLGGVWLLAGGKGLISVHSLNCLRVCDIESGVRQTWIWVPALQPLTTSTPSFHQLKGYTLRDVLSGPKLDQIPCLWSCNLSKFLFIVYITICNFMIYTGYDLSNYFSPTVF